MAVHISLVGSLLPNIARMYGIKMNKVKGVDIRYIDGPGTYDVCSDMSWVKLESEEMPAGVDKYSYIREAVTQAISLLVVQHGVEPFLRDKSADAATGDSIVLGDTRIHGVKCYGYPMHNDSGKSYVMPLSCYRECCI